MYFRKIFRCLSSGHADRKGSPVGVYPLFTVQQSERFLSANISRQPHVHSGTGSYDGCELIAHPDQIADLLRASPPSGVKNGAPSEIHAALSTTVTLGEPADAILSLSTALIPGSASKAPMRAFGRRCLNHATETPIFARQPDNSGAVDDCLQNRS